ncbi:MAG TPA: IS3 family transposase [Ktedonobacteraceae bacterium]|nr:IS3 family transposase [Ktedonobacteraceae bacterium]
MADHLHEYPIRVMCRALEVAESGYYAWKERPVSEHEREDARIAAEIQQIFQEHRLVYGSPRIHAVLAERGIHCGRKRVVRLMQALGLSVLPKKSRQPQRTKSDPHARFAPNLLDRDFTAEAPNTNWVTDGTMISTAEGWLYLAVVLDLSSRRVVGWAMATTEDEELVTLALRMALARRHPQSECFPLLHHSDRGSEYTSSGYQECLR